MTFLTRTAGGESHASILLVERGNPTICNKSGYSPMQDDISERTYIDLQNNNSYTIRNYEQDEEIDGDHTSAVNMNVNQRGVRKTDPAPAVSLSPSSPSSSLSSSWSSSLASSARSFQPHHHQQQEQHQGQAPQQQPKIQQQQQQQEQQKSGFASSPSTQYARCQAGVAKRLDESVAAIATLKQVNRSADLVPLTNEYDKMKRRLRSLIASTKQYHEAMARMHRARMEVVVRLAAVSSNTPIHEKVGGINNNNATMNNPRGSMAATAHQTSCPDDSLASIHKLGFTQCRIDAGSYQESIVDYIVEWENVISTRVDASLDQVHGLQQKLHHYQQKVGTLRKRVHGIENGNSGSGSGGSIMGLSAASQLLSGVTRGTKHINASSGIPVKLEEKLERNQQKLEQAWKEHESAASTLCHLLEEVTCRGWKDLAPLLDKAMEWECTRSMHDYRVFMRLSNLRQETNDLVQKLENCEVVLDSPPRFISNSRIGDGIGARSSGGPPMDIPVMVMSDNDDNEETESSDSYHQFYPDDEVGSIESPPRSRSRSTTMFSPHQMAAPSLVEDSPTSFFEQEKSTRIFSSSHRNNNVETIE